LNVERGGEKTYKSSIKLIAITLMKIHELNTPQKHDKERELEKKDSIKKNHYMQ
jgi:HD-like signal output (HDOD) protein